MRIIIAMIMATAATAAYAFVDRLLMRWFVISVDVAADGGYSYKSAAV